MNNFALRRLGRGLRFFVCLFILFAFANSVGQIVTVTDPNGGFEIDGDLESNTPTVGVGDWVPGNAGSGGNVFDSGGSPIDPNLTLLVRDPFNVNTDNTFSGGSKFNDDPNTWTSTNSNATGKGDIHNAMYHVSTDTNDNEWILVGSDRRTTTGTSYIDFEFYQNTLTTSGNGFISLGPDGGRTEDDILITVEYGSGGSVATIFFYLWKDTGGGNWDYILQTTNTSNAFGQTNSSPVNVPFGSFGTNTYTARQFVESAVNLTAVFGSLPDPCVGVSIKTLFIKTKNSTAPTASLNDFVAPIQVSFTFGTAEISYAAGDVCKDSGPLTVTQTGISGGTYSASPAGLDIDANTGEINVQNSNPGTYTVTYTFSTNNCVKTATTSVTIVDNPPPPVSGGDQTQCEEDPIQTLTATATVPMSQNVVWYDAPTGGNVVANPILNTVGTVTYWAESLLIGGGGCTSLTRTPVTLTINPAAETPVSGGDQTECEEDPIQTLTATATVPVGQTVVWYDAPTGGNVVANPILNTVGTVTFWAEGEIDATNCISLSRTSVTLTINPASIAPPSTGDISECQENPTQTLDANDAVPPVMGVNIIWYDAPTGGNVVANPILNTIGSVTYYAEGVAATTNCTSLNRTAVTLTIHPAAEAPTSTGDITECEEDPIQTLDANDAIVPVTGIIIVWYDAPTGGNEVANPILDFVGTVTYWAEAVSDQTDCGSLKRTPVTLTLNSCSIAVVKEGVFNGAGDCAVSGDTITYTFRVHNTGNVPIANVQISDPLFEAPNPIVSINYVSGDDNNDDLLDTAEIWIYVAVYTVTQADIEAGEVVNQATVQGEVNGVLVTDLSGSTTGTDDLIITILCQNASIALIKVGTLMDENGNGCSDPGETILYTFEVLNDGNQSLSNVTVTDPLINVTGGPIVLNPGESDSSTFSGIYVVTQDDLDVGSVTNQAIAEGITAGGDSVIDFSDDNSFLEDDITVTELCQNASMSVEKTGVWNDENNDSSAQIGETISYTFSVTNTGNVTIYNITLDDPLPGIMIEGGPIEKLEPGETDDTTFTATYVITQQDLENGEVVNQATATGQDINGVVVEDTSDDPNDPTNEDINNDGEPDDPTVVILPRVLPQVDFEIFNGVTPDGDGLNDIFHINGIEDFPNNTLKIYNRWGVLVYDVEGYGINNQFFRGISEGRATIKKNEKLPTGTYYYILVRIDPDNGETLTNTGYLYLNN